ncbi:glutaredoxin family protein [Pseudoclavibacter caeni]|jgi:glutaredoxin|uniref:Glutaredoxin family protein n=1 Tax=Pseudoclavibacter caeni TaxID=908846 RepID=A0A7C8FTT7_9MICO|nr:glutaredoxin family protein [Pseudoclavibacter caeni]KAB1633512.1 glutaredoxin family protein [Pseudoclavibacter caeni]NYJ96490.1 glutaredoxin [Pseudoclavibacter caeni]
MIDVVMYQRPGCHLCDDARGVLTAVVAEARAAGTAVTVREVDIDQDAALRDRYGELVPVIAVEGDPVCQWWADADRLRRAIDRVAGR